jgi:hypothetical protein
MANNPQNYPYGRSADLDGHQPSWLPARGGQDRAVLCRAGIRCPLDRLGLGVDCAQPAETTGRSVLVTGLFRPRLPCWTGGRSGALADASVDLCQHGEGARI